MMRPSRLSPLCAAVVLVSAAPAHARRPMTIDDLLFAVRVGDPALSPDGTQVAYTVATTDREKMTRTTHIFLVPADGSAAPHQLTNGEKSETVPRWSPDGRRLAFISARSGTPQVWLLPVGGGEARKLTDLSTGAGEPLVWSPDGKRLAFVSEVDPSCADDACSKKKAEEREKGPRIHHARRLLYRHWTEWRENVRHHVFVADAGTGRTVDVTAGDFDSPPFQAEDGAIAWSPDSRELCFVSNREGGDREAFTTNHDLWTVAAQGGAARRLTATAGAEGEPHYTPDGKAILYRAQERGGFEADRWRLMLKDRATGKTRVVFETPDLTVDELAPTSDGRTVYFTAPVEGRTDLFAAEIAGGAVRTVSRGGSFGTLQVSADGRFAIHAASTLSAPPDVWRTSLADGRSTRLTDHNRGWLADVDLAPPRSLMVKGAGGAPVQSWLVLPPGFSDRKRYPVVFLIHGGPQGAWSDGWSYRWSPVLWAAQGYVVVAPNPRGSTGFGQKFVDEISRDWGGKVMEDLAAVFDHVTALPYVDRTRQAVAGASYGGYAVAWLIGHTDRFKAAICHDGVFNLPSMALATEELWFPEWEFGGPPWTKEARENMERFSPHLFVDRVKTPTLVITNDLDYRVPVDQGMQLFTALRRRGVPAELLDFPDEGHWVLKPRNSRYWHEQVFGWLKRWLR